MAKELLVTLSRSDSSGFGFSLLGTAGLPHVIYDIVENSPAAECGKVEAGDVILKVNDVDVNRLSTKEVLKCLRLSSDPVTLKLRRDPAVKTRVQRLLSPGHLIYEDSEEIVDPPRSDPDCRPRETKSSNLDYEDRGNSRKSGSPELPVGSPHAPTGASQCGSNGSYSDASGSSELEALLPQADSFKEEQRTQWEPLSGDKFNRPKNTPRFEAYMMTGDLMLNLSRTQQSTGLLPKYQKKVDSLRYNNHHIHHHHNHHNHHHHHHHNSVPTSPNEMLGHRMYKGTGSNSASTSPVGISKRESAAQGSSADNKANANFGYSSGRSARRITCSSKRTRR